MENLNKTIKEIIYYGTLAPSSHNAQMWEVKFISDDEIIISFDQERLLDAVDPQKREAHISIGTFLENIILAAQSYQLEASLDYPDEKSSNQGVVKIRFSPSDKKPTKDYLDIIKKRRAIRTNFEKGLLKPEDIKEIQSTFKENLYYFPLESKEGQYLGKATIEANITQVNNEERQKELSQYMHFNEEEAKSAGTGLTPGMLGISGFKKWFVSHFFTPKTVLSESFKKQTIKNVENQVENCSGFIAITGNSKSNKDLIEAGRLLERFWLTATELKIAIHPMSQVLEESPSKNEINKKLGLENPLEIVLRVGYIKGEYLPPVSNRIPLDKIIVNR